MNIISYDIELKRRKCVKGEIINLIKSSISKHYKVDLDNRPFIESAWNDLPYKDLHLINSAAFLLFSFTIENVQTFVFQKVTKNVTSLNELSVTVVAISQKEINLILKSSYKKIRKILFCKIKVSVIEGTKVNLYPFSAEKNGVIDPSFYMNAEYDNRIIKLDTNDWIKIITFIVITGVFTILYFNTPSEIIDEKTKEKVINNLKDVYGSLMKLGLGFLVIEFISNLLVPSIFKKKYPSVHIKNFSNIFENNGPTIDNEPARPKDPIVE